MIDRMQFKIKFRGKAKGVNSLTGIKLRLIVLRVNGRDKGNGAEGQADNSSTLHSWEGVGCSCKCSGRRQIKVQIKFCRINYAGNAWESRLNTLLERVSKEKCIEQVSRQLQMLQMPRSIPV